MFNFFSRSSFKFKIFSIVGLMGFMTVAIGLVSYFGIHRVEDELNRIANEEAPKTKALNEMEIAFISTRVALRNLGLSELPAEKATASVKTVKHLIEEFEKWRMDYESYLTPQEKSTTEYQALMKAWTEFKEVGARILTHHKAGTPEDLKSMLKLMNEDCPRIAGQVESISKSLSDISAAKLKSEIMATNERADQTLNQIELLAIFSLIFGGLVSVLVANALSKSLAAIALQISHNSDVVGTASREISSSTDSLAQASTEQASSVQETAASLEEITAMIERSSENASLSTENANQTHQKAQEGQMVVNNMLTSMEEISQSNDDVFKQINHSNQELAQIVKLIQEISNKTKVINEIVFQTKLLSFNASVEAARAGEHGKGFAVVAEEVGNLAQMSGNAAKEISDMLSGSTAQVEKIVNDSKDSVGRIVEAGRTKTEAGIQIAKQCSQILQLIVENASKVSELSKEIRNASHEQSQGVGEINKAMAQLDQVNQINTTATQSAAVSTVKLNQQAIELGQTVDELQALVHGSRASNINGNLGRSPNRTTPPLKSAEKSAQVIPFRPRIVSASSAPAFRKAAGDDSTPNSNDSGFTDF